MARYWKLAGYIPWEGKWQLDSKHPCAGKWETFCGGYARQSNLLEQQRWKKTLGNKLPEKV